MQTIFVPLRNARSISLGRDEVRRAACERQKSFYVAAETNFSTGSGAWVYNQRELLRN